MKPLTYRTVGVLLATVVLIVAAKTAMAQDPVKVEPNTYTVLLENDRVLNEVHLSGFCCLVLTAGPC